MTRFQVSAIETDKRSKAIDPKTSVFLTANAGSGKTTILTRRVIRLMLDGADPARILCLTYTKAAAAEMSNRIFGELGAWVRLADPALAAEIRELTGRNPDAAAIGRARALFARAVETPGGLKIQTIHAFAERLLHLFPFEANVPARFTVMDDLRKTEMLETAKRLTIRAALDAPQSELGQAFFAMADIVAEQGFDDLMRAAMPLLRQVTPATFSMEDWRAHLAHPLGIDLAETEEQVAEALLLHCGFGPLMWANARDALLQHGPYKPSSNEQHFVEHLDICLQTRGTIARADALIDLFSTQQQMLRKSMLTKASRDKLPFVAAAADTALERLPELIDRLRRIRTLDRSTALMVVADAINGRYRADKRARALIDFDDMIDRALSLVESDHGASWVLMKLDGGIDHVLIDEAQDTTPEMWRIVRRLTEEFFAGAGARDAIRTVFAVGDEKQSIYSFQGARPEAFDDSRRHFGRLAEAVARPFETHELQLSFRTVEDVLKAVDQVFAAPHRYTGLTATPASTVHETARVGEPGYVEIWPLEAPPAPSKPEAWEPVDSMGENSAQIKLARRLAQHIATLVDNGHYDNDGKRIEPGDIMILVQRRDGFFEAVIRALKRLRVPVAGADRLRLNEEIGVMDLVAAARVALMPDDDLGLAEVMKSPLLGLTDEDLILLAPNRAASLYAALRASEDLNHRIAVDKIGKWRKLAVRETPYGFFSQLLGPMGGRKNLLSRLGPDAADGIDLFLASVLEREGRGPTSLVTEIATFEALATDIRRDQDHGANAVRVLTVHGSKGLEARIVYLPDSHRMPDFTKDAPLFPADSNAATKRALMWARTKERPAILAERAADNRKAKMEEYRRLFYVAMTRARDRLYIAGWGTRQTVIDPSKSGGLRENWYAMAHEALASGSSSLPREDGEMTLQWRTTPLQPVEIASAEPKPDTEANRLPGWAFRRATADPKTLPPLRPSRAIDAADQDITPERDLARQRGDLVHFLIERIADLPSEARAVAGGALLAQRAPRLDANARQALLSQTLALLTSPAAADIFGPGSRAEVAISGEVVLPSGRSVPVLGRIDRLKIGENDVTIADFKTSVGNLKPRDVVQLALYRAVIAQIFPERRVRTLAVFTQNARVLEVPEQELVEALAAM